MGLANSSTMNEALERLLTQLRLAFHSLQITPPIHQTFAQQNLAIINRILSGERIEASRGLHRYLGLAEKMVLQHAAANGRPVTVRQSPAVPAINGRNMSPN